MTKPARKTSTKPSKIIKTPSSQVMAASTPRTKCAAVLALLSSKDGTTITEIAVATGWLNHSVRGFLSGTVKKKMGREVACVLIDGERRYRMTG